MRHQGLHAAPHELLGSDWPALVRFYKGFTAILLYLALKARKREEGADQLQSFIARKNSRLQNLGKAELLKSKASKITMTHYQKNVKNVTGRKKIKSSSSPFKKRQLERFPPQPSENGNKKLFSLPNHFP